MSINDYGWNEYFEAEWKKRSSTMQPGLVADSVCCSTMRPGPVVNSVYCSTMHPARIIADYGQFLQAVTNAGEVCIGRPVHRLEADMQIAVGDWVALEAGTDGEAPVIRFVLPRKTKFSRAAAGAELKEQIVAANVDTVFLIQSLNRDFNMRRLERYLIAAWESGAVPVVVLTKADCCNDVAGKMSVVYETAPGVEVHAVSSVTGEGIDGIRKYLMPGKTVALLGSSGVGKSTLVNTLAGKEILRTQEIREDDSRGRHTTSHREIVLLPEGGLILDTPGMRALSLWEADAGMEIMFGDVEELLTLCRFHDCGHGNEPGCAVREALEGGKLEMKRWESWKKLQKELAHLEAKKEGKLRMTEKQWGKQIAKLQKELYKERT